IATVAKLKAALKETLARGGALGQVRACLQAEVFATLDDLGKPRPAASHETLLMNELIREYLQFHQYNSSTSVFLAEFSQPEIPLDRDFLAKELHVVEDPCSRSMTILVHSGMLLKTLTGLLWQVISCVQICFIRSGVFDLVNYGQTSS
uniref:FGFR1 oncogene partner (FOP) N-terminal dimerisation domain-containing protein n=1 Tax=Laticauda laticaudata TaxID=8630 RepID=A0A8C5SJ02_LATLA